MMMYMRSIMSHNNLKRIKTSLIYIFQDKPKQIMPSSSSTIKPWTTPSKLPQTSSSTEHFASVHVKDESSTSDPHNFWTSVQTSTATQSWCSQLWWLHAASVYMRRSWMPSKNTSLLSNPKIWWLIMRLLCERPWRRNFRLQDCWVVGRYPVYFPNIITSFQENSHTKNLSLCCNERSPNETFWFA